MTEGAGSPGGTVARGRACGARADYVAGVGEGDRAVWPLVGLPLPLAAATDGVLLVGHAVEVGVAAAEGEQVVVLALLDDAAVLEHDDAVGVADGREAVGDDE